MYLIQCIKFGVHEKFGVWTGPKTTHYDSRLQSKTRADSERIMGSYKKNVFLGGGGGRLIVSEILIKVFLLQPIQ